MSLLSSRRRPNENVASVGSTCYTVHGRDAGDHSGCIQCTGQRLATNEVLSGGGGRYIGSCAYGRCSSESRGPGRDESDQFGRNPRSAREQETSDLPMHAHGDAASDAPCWKRGLGSQGGYRFCHRCSGEAACLSGWGRMPLSTWRGVQGHVCPVPSRHERSHSCASRFALRSTSSDRHLMDVAIAVGTQRKPRASSGSRSCCGNAQRVGRTACTAGQVSVHGSYGNGRG